MSSIDKAKHTAGTQRKWARIPPVYWVLLILLLAVVLRVYGIYRTSPPGLEHDEVANWLIDRAILEGDHALYFTEAYGHEAGFHYLQALSVALLGDHALAIRLPAVFLGLLLVAVHFALLRYLFSVPVALVSTAFLAVLFWPVFYSRLGLRAMLLPVVSGIAVYCWWRAWRSARIREGGVTTSSLAVKLSGRPVFWFALAGVLSGLTLYTYMAARAVPIFYGLFLLYLFLFHRQIFKQHWRGILLFIVLFAVVAAPLVIYLQSNPTAEFRISEIDAPLRGFLTGDFRPALQNTIKILGMFGISGDPLWRQNLAGRPVFGPLLAIFFYAGLLVALWRWRDARYTFLLLWLATSAIPSIVTVDAPSSIRMINALLVVTVFPALLIHKITGFSTVALKLSTNVTYLLALVLILTHIWWTAVGIFHIWPENEEVQFVWQSALTDTAAYLDQAHELTPVAIGGWSPVTMDPPTMRLSMRRQDLDLRYFGSDSTTMPVITLIVPQSGKDGRSRITRPTIREFAPELEDQLAAWGASPQQYGSFVLYELSAPPQIDTQITAQETFADQVQFLGYSFAENSENCDHDPCRLLTYWQVEAPARAPLSFFLHAVDSEGDLLAQDDGLDAPSQYWQAGDILVQAHSLQLDSAMPVELRLGVYEPQTGRRLLLADGDDHLSFAIP